MLRPIILIRFSHIIPTDDPTKWQNRYNRNLTPERLNYRFWLFENITLPSLLNQTDAEFDVIILCSPEMHDWAKERLSALIKPLNAQIIYDNQFHHSKAFNNYINAHYSYQNNQRMTVRLDDDDAISCDWIATLKSIASESSGLLKINGAYAIYPNMGFLMRFYPSFDPLVQIRTNLPFALGLAFITTPESNVIHHEFTHFSTVDKMPAISVPNKELSFIRSSHEANDSGKTVNGKRNRRRTEVPQMSFLKIDEKSAMRNILNIEQRFGINIECLENLPEFTYASSNPPNQAQSA